ncbi:MAG: SMP-30/gluconolactonase/LRE family protein [Methylophilaceae bacterium]
MYKKKLQIISLISISAVMLACQSTAAPIAYVPQKVTGLKTPESAIQTKDGRIFVSEINEFGKNGDGQITVIDTTGKASVFASGLDDPKGLAIIGQDLYVADIARIWKITPDGKASVFVPAGAFAFPPQFLNDLETDAHGNLYVSDSGDLFKTGKGGAIYKITSDGKTTLLINDVKDARIKAPNGIVALNTNDTLIEVDFASGTLYSLNQKTGELTAIAEGFGGGDGLIRLSNGTTYVSDWKGGKVYNVNTKGEVTLLKEGYQSAADIAMTKDEKFIMVPDMKAGELDFIPVK